MGRRQGIRAEGWAALLAFAAVFAASTARAEAPADAIGAYVDAYAKAGDFSGVVRVEQDGKLVFERAYGFSDRARKIANTPATRFHIASMSMQFTAAAVMRLADRGDLTLDSSAAQLVGGLPWQGVTVRHLLTERSGLPDINARADYDAILQQAQTPASLVEAVSSQPLLFTPGEKFLHEEHSAYNLLALILETKTQASFAEAVDRLVFSPLGMGEASIDDDRPILGVVAKGYQPVGVYGLEPAGAIHWSAKAGNASVTLSARDEARFVRALFSEAFLTPASRDAVLDPAQRVGFGWFKTADSKRFGGPAYSMNGRSPGFASYVLHLPKQRLTVVALSNLYSSATTQIGDDVAALALGKPVEGFQPASGKVAVAEAPLSFRFGPDFYQASAKLRLAALPDGWGLIWPNGDISPLIPLGPDRFIDRSYWEPVRIVRDGAGHATALTYDRFEGSRETTP
jgi:CubicO group peptidase (beta-lactamase class C family)